MRAIKLFRLFGLTVTISPLGVLSFILAVPLLAWVAARELFLPLGEALIAGLLSSAVMFASELLHHLGHARAARDTGYPMTGLHFFSILAFSRYPADEPSLPPQVHIRRALGGFWPNLLLGLFLAPLSFFMWLDGGVRGWVMAYTAVFNVFVLGLGSLLPIDIPGVFTVDGGTIWRNWKALQAQRRQAG